MRTTSEKGPIAQGLKAIKDRHGLTIEEWAAKSGVPVSSISRYLSSSLNMPNFPYVCAMLRCVGESIDTFYASIDANTNVPADALKLDAVPPGVVADMPMDIPEVKVAMQERLIVQTEEVQAQRAIVREKDVQIELLEARLEMTERVLDEKDRTIARLEETCRRRLEAVQALCISQ